MSFPWGSNPRLAAKQESPCGDAQRPAHVVSWSTSPPFPRRLDFATASFTTAPINPDASERELRELARRRAELMHMRIAALTEPLTLEWINGQITALEARALSPAGCSSPAVEELQACVRRVCSHHWWSRNVRRVATRKREARERAAGRVSACIAPYVSNDTAARHVRQVEFNLATLERTEIESVDGELMTLLAAVEASVSNPAIRRGELMTRVKGAEQLAAACGMVGLMITLTLPSRFHASHYDGRPNANFNNSTVRAGQQHLCKNWARARSALGRRNIDYFGFRVAEPHHDGCPHWHTLIFVNASQAGPLQSVVRDKFLEDSRHEPGADERRFNVVTIDPKMGSAVGYIAKYIAKSTDDAGAVGVEGHFDDTDGMRVKIPAENGGNAHRAVAWARAWGIRQFQAFGQPPVGVWRELRRTAPTAVVNASPAIKAAHEAVNRRGNEPACWKAYAIAQGGAMQGKAHRIQLVLEPQRRDGLYGSTNANRIIGVCDVLQPTDVIRSARKAWKRRGAWTADMRDAMSAAQGGSDGNWVPTQPTAARPWTRVNNCTQSGGTPEMMTAFNREVTSKWGTGIQLKNQRRPARPPSSTSPLLFHQSYIRQAKTGAP